MAVSTDTRDRHETLRLLLQPPRSLCTSTGHYPNLPSQKPVQPATARVPWSKDNFLWRTHGMPQAVATSCWPLQPQARPTFHTPQSHWPEWARAPDQLLLQCHPVWVGNIPPQATCIQRWGQIQSWTPGAVWTKKRKENFSQQPQEQQIKSPQSTWCTLHLWKTWIDNKSSQNWGSGLWEQL